MSGLSDRDFLRQIELDMRSDGLLQDKRKQKTRHPTHVVCRCPDCAPPAEEWFIRLMGSSAAMKPVLEKSPSIDKIFSRGPKLFSVRMKKLFVEVLNSKGGKMPYGELLGYVVAQPDFLPFAEAEHIQID
jgi:hypothetical protein